MTSQRPYRTTRADCFDGISSFVPSIIDLRSKKSTSDDFSLLPSPYCIFSHFLDITNSTTALQKIPSVKKDLLTLLNETKAKKQQTNKNLSGAFVSNNPKVRKKSRYVQTSFPEANEFLPKKEQGISIFQTMNLLKEIALHRQIQLWKQ